jgi:hypothetical protein
VEDEEVLSSSTSRVAVPTHKQRAARRGLPHQLILHLYVDADAGWAARRRPTCISCVGEGEEGQLTYQAICLPSRPASQSRPGKAASPRTRLVVERGDNRAGRGRHIRLRGGILQGAKLVPALHLHLHVLVTIIHSPCPAQVPTPKRLTTCLTCYLSLSLGLMLPSASGANGLMQK